MEKNRRSQQETIRSSTNKKKFEKLPISGLERAKLWKSPFYGESEKKTIEQKYAQIHKTLSFNYLQSTAIGNFMLRTQKTDVPKWASTKSEQEIEKKQQYAKFTEQEEFNESKEINKLIKMGVEISLSNTNLKDSAIVKKQRENKKKITRPNLKPKCFIENGIEDLKTNNISKEETKDENKKKSNETNSYLILKYNAPKKAHEINNLRVSIEALEKKAITEYGVNFKSSIQQNCKKSEDDFEELNFNDFEFRLNQIRKSHALSEEPLEDCSIPTGFIKLISKVKLARSPVVWTPDKTKIRYLRV